MSKTHWATRRCQPSLLTASCCATSQVMLMLFKSCCVVSIQFFCRFPGFFCTAYIPVYSLCWQSVVVVHLQNVPELSQSFLFHDGRTPVVSVPWPSHYWLCLSMRYSLATRKSNNLLSVLWFLAVYCSQFSFTTQKHRWKYGMKVTSII